MVDRIDRPSRPRLVSIVYARFQPPEGRASPERLAEAYAKEWSSRGRLLGNNNDVVTAEDLADEERADTDAADADDPVDEMDALST